MVQKISSGQTFTDTVNLNCGLDIERSNLFFPPRGFLVSWCFKPNQPQRVISGLKEDTPAYDAVLSKHVWLQTDQQFRRYSRNSHILIIEALAVTSTTKIVNQFLCMTLRLMKIHHNTKFVLKWLSNSGGYRPDELRHTTIRSLI